MKIFIGISKSLIDPVAIHVVLRYLMEVQIELQHYVGKVFSLPADVEILEVAGQHIVSIVCRYSSKINQENIVLLPCEWDKT